MSSFKDVQSLENYLQSSDAMAFVMKTEELLKIVQWIVRCGDQAPVRGLHGIVGGICTMI